ncbi:hypothetical protein [Paraglaciecola aestuariivivens]
MNGFATTIFLLMAGLNLGVWAAPNDTEAYYLCAHKTVANTSWTFGTAPAYCDIEPFGDPKLVRDYLMDIVFNGAHTVTDERARYMDEMNAVLQVAAKYYLSVRKPDAQTDEIEAWVHAIQAVANQETFWSHYRDAVVDGRLKMMRGDSGHGHGMMQIDDRWHFTEINQGKGWQIFENLIYAMEIFYAEWQNAASASCVSKSDNWLERTRSAYSAYNGGPSKLCRWHDNIAWQDEGFADKYAAKSWLNYIDNPTKTPSIDVECFMEGVEFCLPEYKQPEYSLQNPKEKWQFNYLKLTNNHTCVLEAGVFHCVQQQQDASCLGAKFDRVFKAQAVSLNEEQSKAYSQLVYERHQCLSFLENSFVVGQSIKAQKDTNIRVTAGGTDTGVDAVTGKAYQILDVVAGTPADQSRYYRIRYSGTNQGYIYAGGVWDFADWATQISHQDLPVADRIIAMQGDKIYIAHTEGVSVTDDIGENATSLGKLSKDTEVEVLDTVVTGNDNQVYYQINANGLSGYFYAGKLLPESTLAERATFNKPSTQTPAPTTPDKPKDSSGGGALGYLLLVSILLSRRIK